MACSSPNVYNDLNVSSPIVQSEYELGIAFGGGGVRGFMHLGVIKALEEAGIKADVVSGTSAGSIAATLYASGMSFEEMAVAIENIGMFDIADFVLSSKGLVNGKSLSDWVNAQVAYDDLADMPIPVAVTATNMTTHKTVIIRSGNPGKAVQTSSTIPGVFLPVEHLGDILIDGGIFSVVPVYTARKLGAKKVIAVDIYCANQTKPGASASKLTLAVFRMQSCRLSQQELESADVVIAPLYEPAGSAAFDDKEKAIEAGYIATMAVITQIRSGLN
ncbi:hypothetical protein R50072_12740 [Simiduia litorea]